MAKLTITDAEQVAGRNRPWTFRLEFVGSNGANQSGVSRKYWYATGRGLNEPVETGWGAIGSVPQHQLIDWTELQTKVTEKLSKGYDYVDTPFIRMSVGSLAKITGQATPPPVVAAPAPVSIVSAAPAPIVSADPVGVTPAALVALGEPYSLVVSMQIVRDGIKVKGYTAVDAKGDALFDMNPQAGLEFAQKYDIDVLWV